MIRNGLLLHVGAKSLRLRHEWSTPVSIKRKGEGPIFSQPLSLMLALGDANFVCARV
jgi:hypothetical protein